MFSAITPLFWRLRKPLRTGVFDGVYAEENNVIQATIDITKLSGGDALLSNNAATAAFDEPLALENM